MALNTFEELQDFLAWVKEEYGAKVAHAYGEKARPKLGHDDFFPHVLLDQVRRDFEDSETRNARTGGLMMRFNS